MIDQDHLSGPGAESANPAEDAAGVMGPRDAPDWMVDALKNPSLRHSDQDFRIYGFKMYDGDQILYYTGRLITDEGDTEEACFGPLDDYGRPNAGCAEIRYPGHPDMDCS